MTARILESPSKVHEFENGLPMETKYGLDPGMYRINKDGSKSNRPGHIITYKEARQIGYVEFDRKAKAEKSFGTLGPFPQSYHLSNHAPVQGQNYKSNFDKRPSKNSENRRVQKAPLLPITIFPWRRPLPEHS